jgi:hypothetical protein
MTFPEFLLKLNTDSVNNYIKDSDITIVETTKEILYYSDNLSAIAVFNNITNNGYNIYRCFLVVDLVVILRNGNCIDAKYKKTIMDAQKYFTTSLTHIQKLIN